VTQVGVARVGGLLAIGGAVVLAWVGLVALAGGSVAASIEAVAVAGLLRPESLAATATGAAPLLLAGLAIAIGLRAGVLNLGVQGQALAGVLAAVLVEDRLRAPAGVLLAAAVLAAMAAGLAWALLPALLRARHGVPEALTTVVASFAAVALLAAVPLAWRPPLAQPPAAIGDLALPLRRVAGDAAWASLLTWTVPLALLGALALALVLRGTTVGPRLRALVEEPRAALLAGVRPGVTATIALLLSAGVAGLVGLQDALATGAPVAGGLGALATSGAVAPPPEGALAPVAVAHLPDYGLLAVAVALAGRASGLGMVAAALALSLVDRAGAVAGPAAGLSPSRVVALQVVLVIAAVAAARVGRAVRAARQARAATRPDRALPVPTASPGPEPVPRQGDAGALAGDLVLEPAIDDTTESARA
jgi:simple sugar transport system permease protein